MDDLPELANMSKKECEDLDQYGILLRHMLKRNSEHVFTEEDPQREDVLNRTIDLLHRKRQGQQKVAEVLEAHITYDALPRTSDIVARTERGQGSSG